MPSKKEPPMEQAAPEGPAPELAEAVDAQLTGELSSRELAVVDPSDQHEVMLRMDDHDVRMLLEQVQSSALRKWVYELKDQKVFNEATKQWEPVRGLTVHAVQDIVQRINWTGKARIGVMPETLSVQMDRVDDEDYWMATIFARDELTGSSLPGASYEPVRMRLRKETADRKRKAGAFIPEDNKVFDQFSRWKAIQKATRNALAGFIPEEIEQSVIAMFAKDPSRVERIQTEAEARVAELPPALTDDKAKKQVARARELYDEIREAGGGQGKVEYTPGHFNAQLTAVQHDHDRLDDFIAYLGQRLDELNEKYEQVDG